MGDRAHSPRWFEEDSGPHAMQAEAFYMSPEAAGAEETAQVWVMASRLAPISLESECRPGGFTAGPSV